MVDEATTPVRGEGQRRDRVLEQIRIWREDLINLARSNRLLYFRHTRSSTLEIAVRQRDEAAEIVQAVLDGKTWSFFEPPEDVPRGLWEPGQRQLVTSKDDAPSLLRALRLLERRSSQEFMEKGLWVLYLAAGMLRWIDPDTDEESESPLLLVPVALTRENPREPYRIEQVDEEPVINPVLAVKMAEFGVTLPSIDDVDPDLETILRELEDSIAGRLGWRPEPRLVIAPFSFHKEVMFRDLLNNEEEISEHPIIGALVNSASEDSDLDFDPIPEERLDSEQPPEKVASILDADATQRQCIAAATSGFSFVMDGPPGTGKSQTIANVIADLLDKGRTVLFVSEKAAALEVVSKRLHAAGIGDYALELHSHKATRKEVAGELGRALTHQSAPRTRLPPSDVSRLKRRRRELSDRAAALNEGRKPLGRTLYSVIGQISQLRDLPQAPPPQAISRSLSAERYSDIVAAAEALSHAWGPVSRASAFLWRDLVDTSLDAGRRQRVKDQVANAVREVDALQDLTSELSQALRLPAVRAFAGAERLRELLTLLSAKHEIPVDWLITESLSAAEGRIQVLRDQTESHERLVGLLVRAIGNDWRAIGVDASEVTSRAIAELRQLSPQWAPCEDAAASSLAEIARFVAGTRDVLASTGESASAIARTFGLPTQGITQERALELAELADLVNRPERPEGNWVISARAEAARLALDTLRPLVESFRAHRSRLGGIFTDAVLDPDLDLETLSVRFEVVHTGLGKLKRGYRADKRVVAATTTNGKADKAALAQLRAALDWQRLAKRLEEAEEQHAGNLGEFYYQSEASDFDSIEAALEHVRRALEIAGGRLDIVAMQRQLAREAAPDPNLATESNRLRRTLATWRAEAATLLGELAASVEGMPLEAAANWAEAAAAPLGALETSLRSAAAVAAQDLTVGAALGALRDRRAVQLIEDELEERRVADSALIGPRFAGLDTDWETIAAGLAWTLQLRELLDGPVGRQTADPLLASSFEGRELDDALARFVAARSVICGNFMDARAGVLAGDLTTTFEESRDLLSDLERTVADIDEWVEYCRARDELVELGIEEPLSFAEERAVPAEQLIGVIERAILERWADTILESDKDRFGSSRSDQLDPLLEDFRQLDTRLIDHAAATVIDSCNSRRPTTTLGAAGIIQREAMKKKRHMPVRRLLEDAGEVVRALKPCFMMSPLTVSQFLPPSMRFDAVIFDEASQVRPSDAVNCIYRGKQLIVAGDDKQLPPTSFFEKVGLDGDEEWDEDQYDEFESILGLCKASGGMRELPLRWHYRSQHEDLITYSNSAFYAPEGHPLITFPGAIDESPDLGVQLYDVPDGQYRRGTSRDNPVEARAVAERVMHWALRSLDGPEHEVTVGVVAFSEAQAMVILAEIDRQRRELPELDAFFAEDRLDGFFVKNLENVQGDERDVMIFSIGYGRDENGRFTLNFGPLNRAGGHRRLNVAITRARRRVEVVSSITADDFPTEIPSEGVRHLRRYLDFAEHGPSALALEIGESGLDAESPFEEEVIRSIRSWGYDVVPQVGVAGYRVDIGVRDPCRPGRYALGIECDGAMYHSSKVARDRDRLRQEVLERLGWRIHRIWGTAWYRHRARQEERLREAIEAAAASGPELPPTRRQLAVPSDEDEPAALVQVDLDALPSWVSAYQVVHPQGPRHRAFEIHEPEARPEVRRMIEEVVSTEGPVAEELVLRRVREAWGLYSAGSRIRTAFADAVNELIQQNRITRIERKFLAAPDAHLVRVRSPMNDPEARRDVDDVPSTELELAIARLVGETIRITSDELTREVGLLFGWRRRGPDIKRALVDAIERLVEKEVLRADGDLLLDAQRA